MLNQDLRVVPADLGESAGSSPPHRYRNSVVGQFEFIAVILSAHCAKARNAADIRSMTIPMNPDDPKDAWQMRVSTTICDFGIALRELHDSNPWPDLPLLPFAMNYLMTELWDHYFSQTEIREAFEAAVAGMPRYAGGDETRP
ncbi:MAG: hypothetical protein ABJB10_03870 [Mesorhizobium sp.]